MFRAKIQQMLKSVYVVVRRCVLSTYTKKNGVLVYVGMHKGQGFDKIFMKYKLCYGFEANPSLYHEVKRKYIKYPNVNIINAAAADYDGEIDFNISSNDGASSSIGSFSEKWENYRRGDVKMIKTIKVPCISLYNFLSENKIHFIEDYVSDIQGFDLDVLKTLKPYINDKRIKNITCETAKDNNIYYDLPDNSEKGFNLLLSENYSCVAKGWGVLRDGKFNDVPDEWWEMDCKWRIKA